jgi:hypothetical protein
MPDSRTISPTASSAVNRSWFRSTRAATRRPAPGRLDRDARASKAKRASAPTWASQRAVPCPTAARKPNTTQPPVTFLSPS